MNLVAVMLLYIIYIKIMEISSLLKKNTLAKKVKLNQTKKKEN